MYYTKNAVYKNNIKMIRVKKDHTYGSVINMIDQTCRSY